MTEMQRITVFPVEMMTAEEWERAYQILTPKVEDYRKHRTTWHRFLMVVAMANVGVTEWDGMSYTGQELD